MRRGGILSGLAVGVLWLGPGAPVAQATDPPAPPPTSAERDAFTARLRALKWVTGPTTVAIGGNATLPIPDQYVYLDAANTGKFEELNENLAGGQEVMIAPRDLHWSAYLLFENAGFVRDDEKIDAPALLKAITQSTEASNAERQRRGWPVLHVSGWALAPLYNPQTRRLEWAMTLQADRGRAVNFFTKILGRHGVTSVVLVSAPEDFASARAALNPVLQGYQFNAGERYAEWRPGDKVAEYGLAGLIVGGAAAAAVKVGLFKGLWKILLAAAASMWKLILAAGVAVAAWVRKLLKQRDTMR